VAKQIMTSRERMLASIQRRQPDHIPLSLIIAQGPWFKEPLYWRNQFERAEVMLEMGLDPTPGGIPAARGCWYLRRHPGQ